MVVSLSKIWAKSPGKRTDFAPFPINICRIAYGSRGKGKIIARKLQIIFCRQSGFQYGDSPYIAHKTPYKPNSVLVTIGSKTCGLTPCGARQNGNITG
jgi:hypothetical protein